jgi:hypothetical protein
MNTGISSPLRHLWPHIPDDWMITNPRPPEGRVAGTNQAAARPKNAKNSVSRPLS